MKKDKYAHSKALAHEMVKRWSDDYLLEKQPEFLTAAYGCPVADSKRILQTEIARRKLTSVVE